MAAILRTLRVGGIAGLITNSATGEQMAAMIADTGARNLFHESAAAERLAGQTVTASDRIAMEGSRSEKHTSELQSLMRHSSAVYCTQQKKTDTTRHHTQAS